jgi:hypothetical protein
MSVLSLAIRKLRCGEDSRRFGERRQCGSGRLHRHDHIIDEEAATMLRQNDPKAADKAGVP